MKTSKKVICLLLTLIMVVSSLPTVVFKVEAANSTSLRSEYLGVAGDAAIFTHTDENGKKTTIIVDTGESVASAKASNQKSFKEEMETRRNNKEFITVKKDIKANVNAKTTEKKELSFIDKIYTTHNHTDHISGLINIIRSQHYYIEKLVMNKLNLSKETKDILEEAHNKGFIGEIRYIGCNMYCVESIARDFSVTILPPFKNYGTDSDGVNNASIQYKFEYTKKGQEKAFIFQGDLMFDGIMDVYNSKVYRDMLTTKCTTYSKNPHHCSNRLCGAYYVGYDEKGNKITGIVKKYMVANKFYTKIYDKDASATTYVNNNNGYYKFTYGGKYYVYSYDDSLKLYRAFTKNPIKGRIGEYTITYNKQNIKIVNYAEKMKSLFATGSGSKLIGIGNVKNINHADAAIFSFMDGCYRYVDVGTELSKFTITNSCNVQDIRFRMTSSNGKIYVVDKTHSKKGESFTTTKNECQSYTYVVNH